MQELYVDSPEAMADLCQRLAASRWLTLDTEFMREKTYYPQLCLLQVATPELAACVDPLATDIGPLLDLLYDERIVKVFHAARQDLELLYGLRGSVPQPLFDTQLAATVLGFGDQIGYGSLVKLLLDVDLDKGQTRTDWSRRPLDAEQIRYAFDDVRYLVEVYRRIEALLAEKGRSDWLAEDFTALSDPAAYVGTPDEAWRRIKGNSRLRGVQLAALQGLAAWREEEARARDLPRRWVVSDEVLLEVARHLPDKPARLERIRGIPRQLLDRHAGALLARIEAARELPKAAWPVLAPRRSFTPAQDSVLDAMTAVVRQCGVEQQVSPAAIATRRDLEQLLDEGDSPVLHGWRAAVAGRRLQAFIEGKLHLGVAAGALVMEDATGT